MFGRLFPSRHGDRGPLLPRHFPSPDITPAPPPSSPLSFPSNPSRTPSSWAGRECLGLSWRPPRSTAQRPRGRPRGASDPIRVGMEAKVKQLNGALPPGIQIRLEGVTSGSYDVKFVRNLEAHQRAALTHGQLSVRYNGLLTLVAIVPSMTFRDVVASVVDPSGQLDPVVACRGFIAEFNNARCPIGLTLVSVLGNALSQPTVPEITVKAVAAPAANAPPMMPAAAPVAAPANGPPVMPVPAPAAAPANTPPVMPVPAPVAAPANTPPVMPVPAPVAAPANTPPVVPVPAPVAAPANAPAMVPAAVAPVVPAPAAVNQAPVAPVTPLPVVAAPTAPPVASITTGVQLVDLD